MRKEGDSVFLVDRKFSFEDIRVVLFTIGRWLGLGLGKEGVEGRYSWVRTVGVRCECVKVMKICILV